MRGDGDGAMEHSDFVFERAVAVGGLAAHDRAHHAAVDDHRWQDRAPERPAQREGGGVHHAVDALPRYAPRLNRLYETYHTRGVAFYGIYPEADETLEGIRAHAQQLGFKFPVVRHGAVSIARAVGATHVPQAFVLNRNGAVVYSGAIDSVTKREVAQHHCLRDVLHLPRHPRPQSEDLVSNPSGYLIDACALILGKPPS